MRRQNKLVHLATSAIFGAAALAGTSTAQSLDGFKVSQDGILDVNTSKALTHGADMAYVVRLDGVIDRESSVKVMNEIFAIAKKDGRGDILLRINSNGGTIADGMRILNAMGSVPNRVNTLCEKADSMASTIIMANTYGINFAYPNCEMVIHTPRVKLEAGTYDVDNITEIYTDLQNRLKSFSQIIATNTFLNEKQAYDLLNTGDTRLTAKDAYNFGIVKGIVAITDKIERHKEPLSIGIDFCTPDRIVRMRSLCGDTLKTSSASGASGGNGGSAFANSPRP